MWCWETGTFNEKDIGIVMTKSLKPTAQCMKATKTAGTVLGQISKGKRCLQVAVYTVCEAIFEICIAAWLLWTETDKECLERLQKRPVRIVSGLKAETYEDRLLELGLTMLEERRQRLDMQQTYRILMGGGEIRSDT